MKDKLEDAEREVRKAKRENSLSIEEYKKEIREGGATDMAFKVLLKREGGKVWTSGKQRKQKKVEHLMRNRNEARRDVTNQDSNDQNEMEGIVYKDVGLEEFKNNENVESYVNRPKIYGGIEISSGIQKILSIDPGFMIYEKISALDVEVEIEKGMAKTRYELMNKGGEDDEEDNESEDSRRVRVQGEEQDKVLNYGNIRATDIPTVQRLHEPKEGTLRQEI